MPASNYCEFDEISRVDTWIQNLAYSIFFLTDFDPLSIYKGNYKSCSRNRYKLYLSPELKLEPNKLDKWRKWFRVRLVIVYLLVMAKFALICLVQLAKYQATTFIRNNSTMTSFAVAPLVRDTKIIKLLRRIYLYDFAGNLLSEFPSAAFFVYATILIWAPYSVYYMPHYYTVRPADAPDLRLAVKPAQERYRIDWMLWENVKQLIMLRESFGLTGLKFQTRFGRAFARIPIEFSHCQKDLQVIFTFDELLRPSRYWLGRISYWRAVRSMMIAVSIPSWSFAALIYVVGTDLTINFNCEIKQIPPDDCTLLNALDTVQIYSLGELVFTIAWLGIFLFKTLLTSYAHLEAQLHSIREMEHDLDNLLEILRAINQSEGSANTFPAEKRGVHLNDALLKMLAKMNYLLAESQSRTQFMSEQVSCFVVPFGVATMLILVAAKLDGPNIKVQLMDVVRYLWAVFNLIMIICAHEFARIMQLQRIGWRIAAQLSLRLAKNYTFEGEGVVSKHRRYPDPITMGWLNLIRMGCLLDLRHSIRPFDVSLNYKLILQANFYVLSLAALVLR